MYVSVNEMVKAEQRAIKQLLIPGKTLMFNAGKSVSDFILDRFNTAKKIGIAVGYGNNGGDGFVTALQLFKKHKSVKIISLGNRTTFSNDSLYYLSKCENAKRICNDKNNFDLIMKNDTEEGHFDDCELIVDALLGTGFQGKMNNKISKLIQSFPNKIPIVSVDIPSGLNGTTGFIDPKCVHADYTVTFARPKVGMKNRENVVGKLIVSDIGIPPICFDDKKWNELINKIK